MIGNQLWKMKRKQALTLESEVLVCVSRKYLPLSVLRENSCCQNKLCPRSARKRRGSLNESIYRHDGVGLS